MLYYRDFEEIFNELEPLNEEVKDKIKDELFRNFDIENQLTQANSYIDKLHNIINILQETIKNLANKEISK